MNISIFEASDFENSKRSSKIYVLEPFNLKKFLFALKLPFVATSQASRIQERTTEGCEVTKENSSHVGLLATESRRLSKLKQIIY